MDPGRLLMLMIIISRVSFCFILFFCVYLTLELSRFLLSLSLSRSRIAFDTRRQSNSRDQRPSAAKAKSDARSPLVAVQTVARKRTVSAETPTLPAAARYVNYKVAQGSERTSNLVARSRIQLSTCSNEYFTTTATTTTQGAKWPTIATASTDSGTPPPEDLLLVCAARDYNLTALEMMGWS